MAQNYSGVGFQGYSDEPKPTEAREGEIYLEIDTAKAYTWHNDKWCCIGEPKA